MKKDKAGVTCSICQNKFSIKSSTWTLSQHLKSHGIHKLDKSVYDGALESEDITEDILSKRPLIEIILKYMKKGDFDYSCSVCDMEYSLDTHVALLANHLERAHGLVRLPRVLGDAKSSDDKSITMQSGGGRSHVWKYFKKENDSHTCLICQKSYSSKTSTAVLAQHLSYYHDFSIQHKKYERNT